MRWMPFYVFLVLSLETVVPVFGAEPTGRYKNILDQMQQLMQKYPGFTSKFSIGTNDDGVEIYAYRISTHPEASDPTKIGQIVVATHHGNEPHAASFAVKMTEALLKKYSTTELFRTNFADLEWTVIPVLNISGYNSNNRYEHGVDPNRDYPGPCIKASGGKLKSIQLLMNYLGTRIFTGSLTVHGYVGTLTYPWGVSVADSHTLDHNFFDQITAKAAQIAGYRYGTSTDVVYPCDGAYEDFVYWKHGMWSLLLELRSGSDSDLNLTTNAALAYFDQLGTSPSTKNQMTSSCSRREGLDLGNE